MYSSYKTIQVELDETVAVMTLCRPEVYNAVNMDMALEIADFYKKAAEDSNIRCLLITGAGKGFCSGADLGAWDGLNDDAASDAIAAWNEADHEMIELMQAMVKPVVVAVNGAAAGAGCDMTLTGDVRFASVKAKFLEAYIKVGYPPDVGGSWLLPRVVGMPKATQMILTGDSVSAQEAERIGLADFICQPEELMSQAMAYAKKLANGPTVAIVEAKKLLQNSWFIGFHEALAAEMAAGNVCEKTEDSIEAVKAFSEGRKPVYHGR